MLASAEETLLTVNTLTPASPESSVAFFSLDSSQGRQFYRIFGNLESGWRRGARGSGLQTASKDFDMSDI